MGNPIAPSSLIQYPQPTPITGLQGAITTGALNQLSEEEANSLMEWAPLSDEQADSPIKCVPAELIFHIFGFLSQSNQGRASCVCRLWRDVAADDHLLTTAYLKNRFPFLQVLDEKVVKTSVNVKALGLDLSDVPPLEPRMIPELQRLYTLPIEGNAGITLGFLPPGFKFNMLTHPQFHKQGNPAIFKYVCDRISTEFGDIPDRGGWFAISNGLVDGSRGLTGMPMSAQEVLSAEQELVKTVRCDIAGFLHVTWLATLTYMNSPAVPPTRLLSDNPWRTFMHCPEQIDGRRLAVGGFGPDGLIVDNDFLDGMPHSFAYLGVGALREFSKAT